LPKEFQVVRCDMPESRTVSVMSSDHRWRQQVTIMEGDVIVVYVKATVPSTISVNQFKLK